jgi:hypothetical protein
LWLRRMAGPVLSDISDRIEPGLCKILQANFAEFTFYEVG